MSDWGIVVPESCNNLFANPSFETNTTGWTMAGAGAAATRGTTHQKFGAYGVALNPAAANMQYYESITVAASSHTLSVFARNAAGTAISGLTLWFDNASVAVATTTSLGDGWYRLDYTGTPTAGARQFGVQVALSVADVYVDGFQLEAAAYRTTYVDGDQPGCRWELGAHSSQSVRSAHSRAGGRVYDFDTDYGLELTDMSGVGMPPTAQIIDEYAIIAGGYAQGYKVGSRAFVVSGIFTSSTRSAYHDERQALLKIVSPGRVPNNQPVLLRYTGGTVTKEIMAYYEAGLELGQAASEKYTERVAIRFFAPDPFWRSIGETADTLDSNDTDTLRYVAGRLSGLGHSTGQWNDLGLSNNPGANGTIWTVLYHSNGYVYYGGDFTNFNQTGTGIDYLVRYDPEADTWALCGSGSDINGIVYDLVETPDGNLLVLGAFTDAGAVALGDYVAVFDVSAGTWSALGDVSTSATITAARCGVYGLDGVLYVGFDGINVGGVAEADYVAKCTGTTWTALGAGFNAIVYGCDVDKTTGYIWWAGNFTTADSQAVLYIATYELGATTTSGGVFNGGEGTDAVCYDVKISDDGKVYVCGNFTQLGSVTDASRLAYYEPGGWWKSMSTATTGIPYSLCIAPDGSVWAVGAMTSVAGQTVTRVIKWNGSTWVAADLLLPGTPNVYAVDTGPAHPTRKSIYDVYIGYSTTGAGYFAGTATVNHGGSFLAYPKITVKRANDGTSAKLVQIRNETLGADLPCSYSLLAGETLTIDLTPGSRSVVSSMFGKRLDAVKSAADFGRFALQEGDNQITAFVDVVGAPTITANILWRTTYASLD